MQPSTGRWTDIQTGENEALRLSFLTLLVSHSSSVSYLYASEPVYYWSHDDDETPIKVLSLVEACRCSTIRKE